MAPGKTGFPPGYRFAPTDGELIVNYLARQIAGLYIPSNPILEVDIYDYSPEDIFRNHNLSENNGWYFFSSRMKKYPNGDRPDRVAGAGFWKATGAKLGIHGKNGIFVGYRTALVYYTGTPKNSEKTNWLMTEYEMIEPNAPPDNSNEDMLLNKWVVCKIYISSKGKAKIDRNQHNHQELANGDQRNHMPPTPVTQVSKRGRLDKKMKFFKRAPFVFNKEIPPSTPQPSHDEQINLDPNDMTVNCVNGYFQEDDWNFLSQSDPQSSNGRHSSDMRMMFNGMNSAPSTSGSTKFYNTMQNVDYALQAHHHQRFPPPPFYHFAYGDMTAPFESDREIPQSWPQPNHNGQINPILNLDDMTDDGVNRYFQETYSEYAGNFLPQSDPQSSHGGHLKPIQDASDMRFDDMMQFYQWAPLESDKEIPHSEPQPSHHGQTNPIFDLSDMKGNGVNPYFQETHSEYAGNFLSQSDPQSSHGGHLKPFQNSSDMRMMFMPSTSGSTKINMVQNDENTPEAHHNQQLPPPPCHDAPFDHLNYHSAANMEPTAEPLFNESTCDFGIFDDEPDLISDQLNSYYKKKSD